MKKKVLIVCLFLAFLIFGIVLSRCLQKPQSKDKIYMRFCEARGDIQIVVDFFLSSDFEAIYIKGVNVPVFADFTYIELEGTVADAVRSLMKEHKFIRLSKHSDTNTLVFQMWTDKMECECGVLYAINNDMVPSVEYLTLLDPLPESGWYYYVSDYNEWRRNNT